jgi:hypothetical protein
MGRALPNHIQILVHRIREHSRRHVGPLILLARIGCAIFVGLFAIVMGGCGAEFGGGVGIVDFPPNVQMERWESIGPGSCKGWLTNNGSHAARDVRVSFWYRTARGDTALVMVPTSTSIDPYAHIAVFAPPQVTNGESRFPALGNITWAGGSSFIPGDPAPFVGNLGWSCLLSPDSARVRVQNQQGLAYHVVLRVETETGVTQVPLVQNPIGRLWSDVRNCPPGYASGCDGWGEFHVGVRDSAGIKLLPKFVSVRWENSAGVADSLLPPYGWPYPFGEYGVSACSR